MTFKRNVRGQYVSLNTHRSMFSKQLILQLNKIVIPTISNLLKWL